MKFNNLSTSSSSRVFMMRCSYGSDAKKIPLQYWRDIMSTKGFLFYIDFIERVINIFIHPQETMLKATMEENKARKNVDVRKVLDDETQLLSYTGDQTSPLTLIRTSENAPLFEVVNTVLTYCIVGGHVVTVGLDQLCQTIKLGLHYLCPYLARKSTGNDIGDRSRDISLKSILRQNYEKEHVFPFYSFTSKPIEATDDSLSSNEQGISSLSHATCTDEPYRQRSPDKNRLPAPASTGHTSQVPANQPRIPQAKHPDYLDRSNRLFSYAFWRYDDTQDKTHLANHGFFYTGEGDLVRCCQCGLGLKDLNPTHDVMKEHIRYSGNCEFLVQLLGPSLLKQKQREIAVEDPLFAGYNQNTQSGHSPGTNKPEQNSPLPTHRHPRLRTLNARLRTFTNWPTNVTQTPLQLAEAGMFYTGDADIVRCWSCDGGLKTWDPNDVPWIEHCRWFPGCKYARDTKGDDYIRLVQFSVENGRQEPAADQLAGPLGNLSVTDDSHQIYQQLREMGFNEYKISAALTLLREQGSHTPAIDAVIDVIEVNGAKVQTPSSNKSSLTCGPSPSTPTQESLLDQNKRLRNMLTCMHCKDEGVNALLLPCGHHVLCMGCSEMLQQCPVCGEIIRQRIKTYVS